MNKAPKVLIAGPTASAGAIREALVKVFPGSVGQMTVTLPANTVVTINAWTR